MPGYLASLFCDSRLLLSEKQKELLMIGRKRERMGFRKAELPCKSLKALFLSPSHFLRITKWDDINLERPCHLTITTYPQRILKSSAPSRMLLFKCIIVFPSYSQTFRLSIFCPSIIQDFGTRLAVFLTLNPASSLMMCNPSSPGPSVVRFPHLQCLSPLNLSHTHPMVIPLALWPLRTVHFQNHWFKYHVFWP